MHEILNHSLDDFFKDKRVLVTGHSGFKGSWMLCALNALGAKVCGYALEPPTQPALFDLICGNQLCQSHFGDIRNFDELRAVFDAFAPQIVIHLAAQPLVLDGYKNPRITFDTNLMGTVNILECVRLNSCVEVVLNVTTDKVYKNNEWQWGFREIDELCGQDPYSNSKSCSELATYSYRHSFLNIGNLSVSTARAGNVIGGGDFAKDRIVPDCVRSAAAGEQIIIRNPHSVRPYQHVLESVFAYLRICMLTHQDRALADSYNIGPDESDCVTTGRLAQIFCDKWGNGLSWRAQQLQNAPFESGFLKLDSSKARQRLGIKPVWGIEEAIEKTVEWSRVYLANENVRGCMLEQIAAFRQKGGF